jgi:hypothetical protein
VPAAAPPGTGASAVTTFEAAGGAPNTSGIHRASRAVSGASSVASAIA